MKSWDETETLINVIDTGSFSAAAKKLNVSKSHISRQVQHLESRLGVQLLNRTTRSIAPTEIGEAYYQRCRSLLAQFEEAEQAVQDRQTTPSGTLRLTVAGAFGERFVAPAAAEFMLQHPQIDIHLDFISRNVDLVEEGYDLAIRSGILRKSSLIARRIASRKLIICANRDYFDRKGTPINRHDLKDHNCLIGSVPTWRFREPDGQHVDVKVEGNWHSNNGYALLGAALKGLGLVQLPEFYVHNDVQNGRLIPVLQEHQPNDTAVWAVYPSNRYLSAKVRLFVDHLIAHLGAVDYL